MSQIWPISYFFVFSGLDVNWNPGRVTFLLTRTRTFLTDPIVVNIVFRIGKPFFLRVNLSVWFPGACLGQDGSGDKFWKKKKKKRWIRCWKEYFLTPSSGEFASAPWCFPNSIINVPQSPVKAHPGSGIVPTVQHSNETFFNKEALGSQASLCIRIIWWIIFKTESLVLPRRMILSQRVWYGAAVLKRLLLRSLYILKNY